MNLKQIVLKTLQEHPETRNSNTELYIRTLHDALRGEGNFLPSYVSEMIRKLKPEAITRARRAVKVSTADQLAEAMRYREEYKPNNPNPNFND